MDKIIRYPYSLMNTDVRKSAYVSTFLFLLYLGYLVYKRRRRFAFLCYLDKITPLPYPPPTIFILFVKKLYSIS